MTTYIEVKDNMTLEDVLERIQDILNQGVDTEYGDLDLLRHELENVIIEGDGNDS